MEIIRTFIFSLDLKKETLNYKVLQMVCGKVELEDKFLLVQNSLKSIVCIFHELFEDPCTVKSTVNTI